MGNPAMVRRKKSEKRRKKFEQRLGPGAYLPKADREQYQAELKQIAEADAKAKADRAAKKAAEPKAEKKAAEPKA